MLGLFPIGAFAERTDPSSCNYTSTIPLGYCCISYRDDAVNGYKDYLWNCDDLNLNSTLKAACKTERTNCLDYCSKYDLDNNTCSDCSDISWRNMAMDEDCTIPNATLCDYTLVCDNCGVCRHENETVYDCDSGYYMTEDFEQCLKCPGNGVVDYDVNATGIYTCYILRNPTTGSDTTGTFQYVNNRCYYK